MIIMSYYKVIYRPTEAKRPASVCPVCPHLISVGSAVFAQLMVVINRHTHHDITVAIGRIYALRTCDAA